jgi:hypothetical protein
VSMSCYPTFYLTGAADISLKERYQSSIEISYSCGDAHAPQLGAGATTASGARPGIGLRTAKWAIAPANAMPAAVNSVGTNDGRLSKKASHDRCQCTAEKAAEVPDHPSDTIRLGWRCPHRQCPR